MNIKYLGMSFAKLIGVKLYNTISVGYPSNMALVGDFIFSTHLFNKTPDKIEAFIDQHMGDSCGDDFRAVLSLYFGDTKSHDNFVTEYRAAIKQVSGWVISTARYLSDFEADIYGFTSMFQQNLGSLAIARELKKLRPNVLIVFGGPNCESPMGNNLMDIFPFIDMVCSGEGEEAFVSLLDYMEEERAGSLHPNIIFRNVSGDIFAFSSSIQERTNLENLSPPDYDDYFNQLSKLGKTNDIQPRVLLETSRGCWWGQKAHCTFCGLNGSTIKFRAKSAEKALQEIRYLTDKYPGAPISVVDNIIDYKYFKTLLPRLASEKVDVELFYETKANLKKEQLAAMRSSGITRIQPGIESLSSNVLRLMKKGVKAIQNICLLKWCIEEGVKPEWNLLWGFPNEEPEDYRKMVALVPYLQHMTPPNGFTQLRLDRYSPLYENRENEPIVNVRPYRAYYHVYDMPENRHNDLSYYFEFDYVKQPDIQSYIEQLEQIIARWKASHQSSFLIYSINGSDVLVFDGRHGEQSRVLRFATIAGDILQKCEEPTSINRLMSDLHHSDEFYKSLESLILDGVIIEVDDVLFNVAVELSRAQSDPTGFSAFLKFLLMSDTKCSDELVTVRIVDNYETSE